MNLSAILTNGGVAGFIYVVYLIGKLILDALREKNSGQREGTTSSVTDASTANAIILRSLQAVNEENKRLNKRCEHLESENASKESKIVELQQRVQKIADELAALKTPL